MISLYVLFRCDKLFLFIFTIPQFCLLESTLSVFVFDYSFYSEWSQVVCEFVSNYINRYRKIYECCQQLASVLTDRERARKKSYSVGSMKEDLIAMA